MKGVKGNIDNLMTSEIKQDVSFPSSQFLINGYTSPYRLDQNGKNESILVYVWEDIPSKLFVANLSNAEGFF